MTSSICLLFLLLVLFEPVTLVSYYRLRQQKNSFNNNDPSYDAPLLPAKNPSGSIGGTSYYGIGTDPNYGSFVARPNRPGGGALLPISYDQNSPQFQYHIKPRRPHQQHLPRANHLLNYNNPNLWQRPRTENQQQQSQTHKLPVNRGWYSARDYQINQRGDGSRNPFWINQGQSIMAYPSFTFITLAILVFCK